MTDIAHRFRITRKRRTALERVLREHYNPKAILAAIELEMLSPHGRKSFEWLNDLALVEMTTRLGMDHRRSNRVARKIRALGSA